LSDPQTIESLKTKPEETLNALAKKVTDQLPTVLPEPGKRANDAIWLIIVCAFALVMVWSGYVLGSTVTTKLEAGTAYVTKSETILTLFTTVVGFLAGLLVPSPVKK
jgi:mannose/fructose/N-acetylgalactosamine-specific phosphotransferase system component IID